MRLTATRRRLAMLAAGAMVVGGVAVVPGVANAATACNVVYATNDWNNGFTANVTIENLGDPLTGWTLQFTFPGSQRVTQGWSANWTQSGNVVTATNAGWNGNLATGQSTNIGFNGSHTGSNPKPTSFSINGVTCNGAQQNQPPTVGLTIPSGPFTAPADVPLTATASDPDGTIDRVEFYRNGLLVNTDTTSPYQYVLEDLPAGSYTVQARAYDNAGASATAERAFTVGQANPGPTLVATPSSVSVDEGGSSTFNLRLSSAPTANVPVTLAIAGDSSITRSPSSVTLTPSNWNTGATVTVSAAEDDDTVSGTATITATASGLAPLAIVVTEIDNDSTGGDSDYIERFLEQYGKIKNSGYFSPEGVPYHSIETLIVEAPDHGHETTSEAFSFWIWLEASYGRVTENWAPFNNAWTVMEQYIIPGTADQPTAGVAGTPQYAAEYLQPNQYPSRLDQNVPVGVDPLRNELQSAYGTGEIYGMHWLLDVDNVYGYGHCGDGTTRPAYINTFQRGPQESVWETVPQPSCDTKAHGGPNGYLDLFVAEDNAPASQWKYTNAPDADARAIQAAYWALIWAEEQGNEDEIAQTIAKAARMGDYLRYAMFDKYFKRIGNCVGATSCPAGTGKDSAHYLMSWYYAWGGATDTSAAWSWRIGSSHNHMGYQNPFAAWALTNVPELRPRGATAVQDWTESFDRQMEFYQWLQSADGAIAGGATNSWNGSYAQPPAGTPTFYGMYYTEHPVYHDPGSNEWFGMQVWSLQRVAEVYHVTGDARAKQILDKWVPWAISHTEIGTGGDFSIPSTMEWSGAPDTWNATNPGANNNLRVEVVGYGQDVGVASAYARTLMWYAARSGNTAARDTAKGLLDALHANAGPKGVTTVETRGDYRRFDDVYNASTGQGLYIPNGWSGTMPNGDVIEPGKSFLDIRSFYLDDPDWPKVEAYLNGGPEPEFEYHRFWAQADLAMAYADFALLFPDN